VVATNLVITMYTKRRKLPPHGKQLAERQKYLNIPDAFAIVTVGADCWERAKQWKGSPNDTPPMVLADPHPEAYIWPVNHCIVVVEVGEGPSAELIERLVHCLFQAGASGVVATTPDGDDTKIFNRPGVHHAAAA